MMLCELKNVTKTYEVGEKITPLDNVSFNIEKGKFIAISGESGIGKSTLLMVAGGLLRPTKGSILYYGTDYWKMSEKERTTLRAKKIGYLFQSIKLVQALTLKENMLLAGKISGQDITESHILEILESLGLLEKKDSLPHQLSGGQKRRAMIAITCMRNPELIFADEPTNDLDEKWESQVISIFRKWVNEGKTVVMVTHNRRLTEHVDICYEIKDKVLVNTK